MSSLGPSMEHFPEDVMVDILSRLPVKTIVHCKCVCSKWRNIVSDSYFAHLQLLRSPAGLIIHRMCPEIGNRNPGILKWVEVEDELDHYHLHHDPLMSLDLNLAPVFQKSYICPMGSVNGLICLWNCRRKDDNTYICNPITREYMILPKSQIHRHDTTKIVYGFGVSSLTREYKVIIIFQGKRHPDFTSKSEAEVYTVGTGQWRSLSHVPYRPNIIYGPFLNGHAHWTIVDHNLYGKICAFDFDTETFELFPSPPEDESQIHFQSLGVVKGCLCRCDAGAFEFRIWVMKEYGIKKSWYKEVIIRQRILPELSIFTWDPVYPIWGFKDGTILMISYDHKLWAYCPRRETIVDTKIFGRYLYGLGYRPSFYRLHNFENERVHVF